MSSETSTDPAGPEQAATGDTGFRPEHFYVLGSMVAAIVGVMMSRNTHPAALLLLSAALVGAGLTGAAAHRALSAFLNRSTMQDEPVGERRRGTLLREKQYALRVIKELEFDRKMGKISEKDFHELAVPLRARAAALIRDVERSSGGYRAQIERDVLEKAGRVPGSRAGACGSCGTANDADARFCKSCGKALAA